MVAASFEIASVANVEQVLVKLRNYRPHVSVVFDPWILNEPVGLPGITLGVLVAEPDGRTGTDTLAAFDRLVSFDPRLTGESFGDHTVWRAIPVPVSDALFAEVHPMRHAPRAMSIGRSTPHREGMLVQAKHRCDLLQVVHGLSAGELAELLDEYDVGVYISPETEGGFGYEVGAHLAAGQLLVADRLTPSHGLEPNIDYLQVGSPDELAWTIERLERFPRMHDSLRVRGRLKAESYRASGLFARVAYDLLADVSAFGELTVSG